MYFYVNFREKNFEMVKILKTKKKTDWLMFEKICFFWRKFSKDTPFQNDDENMIGIPPSKTQKVFEGGILSEPCWYAPFPKASSQVSTNVFSISQQS